MFTKQILTPYFGNLNDEYCENLKIMSYFCFGQKKFTILANCVLKNTILDAFWGEKRNH